MVIIIMQKIQTVFLAGEVLVSSLFYFVCICVATRFMI